MVLIIKNMVCNRCIAAVEAVMNDLKYPILQIKLGEVRLAVSDPDETALNTLRLRLEQLGFELLDDQRQQLIAQIKSAIIAQVHHDGEVGHLNLSEYLPSLLHRDYSALSRLFSETEGRTIEQFYIEQRIERVKELIIYNERTLSEIAWLLDYSSVAHLSSQFKKITGLTPTQFRQLGASRRKALDSI